MPGELTAAHPRHDEVGNHEVDLLFAAGANAERLGAIARLEYRIATSHESRTGEGANACLVLDDQERLDTADRWGDGLGKGLARLVDVSWKVDLERRPDPLLAVDPD